MRSQKELSTATGIREARLLTMKVSAQSTKALLINGGILAGLLLSAYISSSFIFMSSFSYLEDGYAFRVMAAVGLVFGGVVVLLLKRRLEAFEISNSSLEQAKENAETLSVALKNELEKGWRLQQDFLPQGLPQLPGWELGALLRPARDVSGDFYDAFTTSRGRVALVIGDVCDKGVGSAFFMALSRSLIRIFCDQTEQQQADPPDRAGNCPFSNLLSAVRFANDYIIQHHSETSMFITLFFAVLDPDTGLLSYINAGHEPPTILGPAGVKARLGPNGPALGVIPDIDFEIGQVHLKPGDMLFAYTDGVTEARNPDGKFFTEEELLGQLKQCPPSAVALLDGLERCVQAHMSNAVQFDDITMLAVQRVPVEASQTLTALPIGVSGSSVSTISIAP